MKWPEAFDITGYVSPPMRCGCYRRRITKYNTCSRNRLPTCNTRCHVCAESTLAIVTQSLQTRIATSLFAPSMRGFSLHHDEKSELIFARNRSCPEIDYVTCCRSTPRSTRHLSQTDPQHLSQPRACLQYQALSHLQHQAHSHLSSQTCGACKTPVTPVAASVAASVLPVLSFRKLVSFDTNFTCRERELQAGCTAH